MIKRFTSGAASGSRNGTISKEDILVVFPKGRATQEYWEALGCPKGLDMVAPILEKGMKGYPEAARDEVSKRKGVLLILVFFALANEKLKARTFEKKDGGKGMPYLMETYRNEALEMGRLCELKF
jgi:hypothetical protein